MYYRRFAFPSLPNWGTSHLILSNPSHSCKLNTPEVNMPEEKNTTISSSKKSLKAMFVEMKPSLRIEQISRWWFQFSLPSLPSWSLARWSTRLGTRWFISRPYQVFWGTVTKWGQNLSIENDHNILVSNLHWRHAAAIFEIKNLLKETASASKLEWPSWTLIVIFVLITMSIGWIPFIAITRVSLPLFMLIWCRYLFCFHHP